MRKIFALSLIFLAFFAVSASAEVIVGRHSMLNFTEEQMLQSMKDGLGEKFYIGLDVDSISLKYYDSLALMQLALDRGEIDAMTVPFPVGQFVLNSNPGYVLKGLDWWFNSSSSTFNCAFLEKNSALRDRFNEAIKGMKNDGMLAVIENKYVDDVDVNNIAPVEFEKFDGAETITVAVTGDMPPIDYVAADGTPAGYNTAILSEIGKRLHANIKVIDIETGARVSALTSGRADVVFWFQSSVDNKFQADVPSGIILSEPYYKWNEQYFIGKK